MKEGSSWWRVVVTNGFVLVAPPLVWDLVFTGRLLAAYKSVNGESVNYALEHPNLAAAETVLTRSSADFRHSCRSTFEHAAKGSGSLCTSSVSSPTSPPGSR